MASTQPSLIIARLADHLDAALAACEDLSALTCDPNETIANGVPNASGPTLSLEDFTREARRFELAAALRIIAARDQAEALIETDARFTRIARMLIAGTHTLVDAASDAGLLASDPTACALTEDSVSFLRNRGVLAVDQAAIPEFAILDIPEHFRLCGTIEIGPLMDLIAGFLDQLEIHFELFGDDEAAQVGGSAGHLDLDWPRRDA